MKNTTTETNMADIRSQRKAFEKVKKPKDKDGV